jgi:hypothetical protein
MSEMSILTIRTSKCAKLNPYAPENNNSMKNQLPNITNASFHLIDQDMACVKNCDDPDPRTHEHFEQPIWQTLNMFLGETLCLVAASVFAFLAEKYGRAKWAEFVLDEEEEGDILATVESDGLISSPSTAHGHGHGHAATSKKKLEGPLVLLLWLPTLCDMTASTVRNTI